MFLMLGDNDSHVFFNTWRLPRLLRLCNTKSLAHHSMTNHMKKKKKKNSHMLKKNSQDATHVSKNSISRQKTHVNFFFPTTKTHMTKNCYQPKIMRPKRSMPHQKFHHNQNVSHIHTQQPNLFFITMHKNFYMTKIANK